MTKQEIVEKEIEQVCTRGFWTFMEEMIADLQWFDYEIIEINDEFLIVEDVDGEQFKLTVGHANKTMWIKSVKAI